MSEDGFDQIGMNAYRHTHGRRHGKALRVQQAINLERGQQLWGLVPQDLRDCKDMRALFQVGQQEQNQEKSPLQKSELRELWLEIGFGGGEHSHWQAKHNPKVAYLGAEYFINGISLLCKQLNSEPLSNFRFFVGDGRLLLDALKERRAQNKQGSQQDLPLTRVFILHPDPWPKRRHHKRRIISAELLDLLADLMPLGAILRCATDHEEYKQWMLQQLLSHPRWAWRAQCKSDWDNPQADWPQTRYEAKSLQEGRRPLYLEFERQDNSEYR